jgi:DNA-binding NarL/FixJ family response regulator
MVKSQIGLEGGFDPTAVRGQIRKALGRLLGRFRAELKDPKLMHDLPRISPTPIATFDEEDFTYILSRVPIRPDAVLSDRETRVVMGVREGLANKTIARNLGLSTRTVAAHLERIYSKLGIKSRVELAMLATRFEPSEKKGAEINLVP